MTQNKWAGFTLLEVLMVIALVAILIVISIERIDVERVFARRRDFQRQDHIQNIWIALDSYRQDNRGNLPLGISTDFNNPSLICLPGCDQISGRIDFSDQLNPYIDDLPQDPQEDDPELTGYTVYITDQGRIVVSAPRTERGDILNTEE